jgi:hypothetical protein
MKQALIYSLKVWLTGVSLGLIAGWLYFVMIGDKVDSLSDGILMSLGVILYTLAFGVPFFLCVWLVLTFNWHYSLKKLLLSGISFLLGWLPIMVLVIASDDLDPLTSYYRIKISIYLFFNCMAIWVYKLEPDKE